MAFALWSDGADGWDRCDLATTPNGHRLAGQARLGSVAGRGQVDYVVDLCHDWSVARVEVVHRDQARGERSRELAVVDGRWIDGDGRHLAEFDGCRDIDLGFTPAAVAPLMRRLGLVQGSMARVEVVHLGLGSLDPSRDVVEVAHLESHRWSHRFRGHDNAVHLGPQGLVVEHERGWTALAVG